MEVYQYFNNWYSHALGNLAYSSALCTYIRLFAAVLFVMAKVWEQPKCPLIRNELSKYTIKQPTMEYWTGKKEQETSLRTDEATRYNC